MEGRLDKNDGNLGFWRGITTHRRSYHRHLLPSRVTMVSVAVWQVITHLATSGSPSVVSQFCGWSLGQRCWVLAQGLTRLDAAWPAALRFLEQMLLRRIPRGFQIGPASLRVVSRAAPTWMPKETTLSWASFTGLPLLSGL